MKGKAGIRDKRGENYRSEGVVDPLEQLVVNPILKSVKIGLGLILDN